VFCIKFFGLLLLGVRLLGFALGEEDNGQILVGQPIARIKLNVLPVLGDHLRGFIPLRRGVAGLRRPREKLRQARR
jgi:hypothetical protein